MDQGTDINRFAPPTSEVRDVAPASGTAPPLWNPNATANWSFLFTPVFGAYLQMKNWQALGDDTKAAQSRRWAIGSALFLVLIAALSLAFTDSKALDAASRTLGFGLLAAWYFSHGRAQVQLVKARFGKTYPRRGWTQPLLIALVGYVGFIAMLILLAAVLLGDKL